MATTGGEKKTDSAESCVTFRSAQGGEFQGKLLRLGRFDAAVEVYSPAGTLRLSEALERFRIALHGHAVYNGRAVVTNLIALGSALVCEVAIEDGSLDLGVMARFSDGAGLRRSFEDFMSNCGRNFRILPEFKVAMADMQTFFIDLRIWLDQVELGVFSRPESDRGPMEREILAGLQSAVLPAVAPVLERFEQIANTVEPDLRAAHRAYMKRQIHPVVLCSPFLFRTFHKPLGYAGDYEMVNMMVRDPFEGGSMFAKMVNRIFLDTPPVVAHRNRIAYLTDCLVRETARAAAHRKLLRVFNLGCGPAREVRDFLRDCDAANHADFTLLDFSEEALDHTSRALTEQKAASRRTTPIRTLRRSAQQVLKDAGLPGASGAYDMIYCAGLFDYLNDAVCKRLMNYFYEMLAPGGLLLGTNVSSINPSNNWMEYVLDWFLVYRGAEAFKATAPDAAPPDCVTVKSIDNGVNIALEVRKPLDGA